MQAIGLTTVDPNADPMVEIFKNSVVGSYKARKLIHYDEASNDYYMDIYDLTEMMKQASLVGNTRTGLDFNVTEPNTLTLHGNINVRDIAILSGFKIDNEQFESLSTTNGRSNILLNGANGSGHLAAGNIVWDAIGNLFISGAFESNQNGNRVTIDPQGSIKMINSAEEEIMTIHTKFGTPYIRFKYKELDVENEVSLSSSGLEIISDGSLVFSVNSNSGEMFINPNKIPTSSDNLIPGSIYRTGETLKVKVSL